MGSKLDRQTTLSTLAHVRGNNIVMQRLGLPGPYELHPRSYYTYELRGVVVHTGTANQGHYFSYIRDPNVQDEGRPRSDTFVSGTGKDGGNNSGRASLVRSSPSSPAVQSSTSSPSTTSLSVDDSSGGGGSSAGGNEAKEPAAASSLHEDGAVSSPLPPSVPEDGERVGPGGVSVARGAVRAADSDGQGKGKRSHRWCEFNDTVVKEWAAEGRRREDEKVGAGGSDGRIGGLETDCFGGQQTMQVSRRRQGQDMLGLFPFRLFVICMQPVCGAWSWSSCVCV